MPTNSILVEQVNLYVDQTEEEVLTGTLDEIVAMDKIILTPGLGTNIDLDNVISDLTFDLIGHYESSITWDATAHSQITDTGVVTRGGTPVTANVTATIAKYSSSDTKIFSITVLAV